MPPSTRLATAATAATAAGKGAAEPADTPAENAAAKRDRALAAAASNEPAAGAAARPANGAVYARLRTRLLGLPSRERAGFLDESLKQDPGRF